MRYLEFGVFYCLSVIHKIIPYHSSEWLKVIISLVGGLTALGVMYVDVLLYPVLLTCTDLLITYCFPPRSSAALRFLS